MANVTTVNSLTDKASATTRVRGRQGTTKERKDRSVRGRFSHDGWLRQTMPCLIDSLCQKLYENGRGTGDKPYVEYEDRKQFCAEYADLVIDQRRVSVMQQRVRDLDEVLAVAVRDGRVVIRNAFYGRRLVIELSMSERAKQDAASAAREAEQRDKWLERRRAKGR